jgi:hypothetical protein
MSGPRHSREVVFGSGPGPEIRRGFLSMPSIQVWSSLLPKQRSHRNRRRPRGTPHKITAHCCATAHSSCLWRRDRACGAVLVQPVIDHVLNQPGPHGHEQLGINTLQTVPLMCCGAGVDLLIPVQLDMKSHPVGYMMMTNQAKKQTQAWLAAQPGLCVPAS